MRYEFPNLLQIKIKIYNWNESYFMHFMIVCYFKLHQKLTFSYKDSRRPHNRNESIFMHFRRKSAKKLKLHKFFANIKNEIKQPTHQPKTNESPENHRLYDIHLISYCQQFSNLISSWNKSHWIFNFRNKIQFLKNFV